MDETTPPKARLRGSLFVLPIFAAVGSLWFFFINSSARRPRRSRRGGSAAPEGRVYCCFAQGLGTETGTSLPEAME